MNLRFHLFVVSILLGIGCSNSRERPNVILLTLDTLRADSLGCYGHSTIQTPNLDRIAREGILFENAVCQIPATLTSHTAILTGRNPKSTGVRFRTAHVSPLEETLAERFQSHGYTTAAFISSFVLAPEFGLNQGFEKYELGSMIQKGKKIADERRAEETIRQTISFLKNKPRQPFLIWIHLYDPHTPYDPPEPFAIPHETDSTGVFPGSVEAITRLHANQGKNMTPDDLQKLRNLYSGEVDYMDAQIGHLLKTLDEMKLMDRTIIAALADHGENLGENGRFFHGDDLYQPSVHIPFLLRYPRQIAGGQRVSSLVQSIDLFPTLLDLAEIPPISGIEGRSLVSILDGKKQKKSIELKPAYLETEADAFIESNKLYGLCTETHKFLYFSAHRRSDVPLGIFSEIPLKGPTLVLMRIQGDPSIRLMAHVRYRTKELYTSRNFEALASLNTTVIHAETAGVEPLQQEAMKAANFYPTPGGWQLHMTPDIHRLARSYGLAQGWPVEWMVLEGVGVDAALPARQKDGIFSVDQIELYAPSLRFPESPRYRSPFWIIEDFERSEGLIDSGEGPPHTIQSEWLNAPLFGGQRQQKITITFHDEIDIEKLDELFAYREDTQERNNLLTGETGHPEIIRLADNCRSLLDSWVARESGHFDIQPLDTSHLEALQALGYSR